MRLRASVCPPTIKKSLDFLSRETVPVQRCNSLGGRAFTVHTIRVPCNIQETRGVLEVPSDGLLSAQSPRIQAKPPIFHALRASSPKGKDNGEGKGKGQRGAQINNKSPLFPSFGQDPSTLPLPPHTHPFHPPKTDLFRGKSHGDTPWRSLCSPAISVRGWHPARLAAGADLHRH